MHAKTVIYPAAALFNARETYFNSILVEKLENLGYRLIFPRRMVLNLEIKRSTQWDDPS
jgi:hypothetical protein